MATPFFSVVLPTKNRAGVLPYALHTLKDQTFRDFEVVLVDNDDTDATAAMVRALAPGLDDRFRYQRTGGLWMSENWEAALPGLRGEYVYVMEDKAILHPRALELLARSIEFYHPRVLVFSANQHAAPPLLTPETAAAAAGAARFADLPPEPLPLRPISSTRIIDEFLVNGWRTLHDDGPRGINSVCERELVQQIQAGAGGGRFFLPFAPDVTSALLQLDVVEGIGRMELQLVSFARHVDLSLGWRFRVSLAGGAEVMAQAGAASLAHFEAMPLGHLAVLHNHLYAEFLMVRARAQGWLRGKMLAAQHYCDRIAGDLDELERGGEAVGALRARLQETRARLGDMGL
jgi:hypothetical protein